MSQLDDTVEYLELSGGNVTKMLKNYEGCDFDQFERALFTIYKRLEEPENKELLKRWNSAIERGEKLRYQLLRSRAFDLLEGFYCPSDKAPSPIVAYANFLIGDIPTGLEAAAKAKFSPRSLTDPAYREDDPQDEADEDIRKLSLPEEKESA
jgi:hypothetical protein